MMTNDLTAYRAEAYEFLLGGQIPMSTPAIARRLFGAHRHEMPETQVVVRALLQADPRFVETHDRCWTVLESPLMQKGLLEATYAVVDLETTGSVIGVDEIIEVGVYHVRRGRISRKMGTRVWTDRPIPPWVARLTGIHNDDIEGAPTFSDIAPKLLKLLDGHVFVAHDIRFDLPFLRWEFARRGLSLPGVTGLCTLQLSRHLWPELTSRSLADLASHFQIAHANPHRAADDAGATAGVLTAALRAAREQGLDHLGQLYSLGSRVDAASDEEQKLAARSAES
ncbi:hypothetical protein CO151_01395 [bacterium CG_4_9_14_3_um_filter_65_15]|nr:MAG: hypothetical protein CO151_01395 [bacterium CG_4_9_14_3_um_filter_65_15]